MPCYAITGASKGIGLEFVRQLAANEANTVLAIVRDPSSKDISDLASNHTNLHVVKGDVTDPKSMIDAASTAAAVTDGKLDVLIQNSNAVDLPSMPLTPSQLPFDAQAIREMFDPPLSTGVYGGLWATNAFLPLIEKGDQKKIVHISSVVATPDFVNKSGLDSAVPYSVAKLGMNVLVAKYAAELAPKGIKVLALSPGWVDTTGGRWSILLTAARSTDYAIAVDKAAREIQMQGSMVQKFQRVQPGLQGPIQPEESVSKSLQVIEHLDAQSSGLLLSHNGDNKSWF